MLVSPAMRSATAPNSKELTSFVSMAVNLPKKGGNTIFCNKVLASFANEHSNSVRELLF